jgi:hypothetical protein
MKEKKTIEERKAYCLLMFCFFSFIAFLLARAGMLFAAANIIVGTIILLLSFFFLYVGSAFLAIQVVSWIGNNFGKIFTFGGHFNKPQPAYSLPEGLAASGQYACAILAYNELAKNHPEEILPHLRVMRIWIEKMNDVDAAVMAYNLALKKIRGQKNRNEFVKMAKNNFSKFISFE